MEENRSRPSNYTMGHEPATLKSHSNRDASSCAGYLLPHIRPGDKILDVGCGPGTITLGLAECASQGLTIGIDYSPTAIEAAKKEAKERGCSSSCQFSTGNAYSLQWAEDTFDVVHAHQCLVHLADPVAGMKEMRRVCKAAGVVAARDGDYGAFTLFPDTPLLLKTITIFEKVTRAGGSETNAGRRLVSWARQAGYRREELVVSASVEVYSTRKEREFIGGRWHDRLLHSQVGNKAVELGVASREEIESVAKAWKEWIDDDDGYFAIPSTEILCWKNSL